MHHQTWIMSVAALTLLGCSNPDLSTPTSCALETVDQTSLETAKSNGFTTMLSSEFRGTVTSLSQCLGHPDPAIRDELAYGTLTAMLRSGQADPELVRSLRDDLYEKLDGPDPEGFLHPFAALVLSEVARVDRVSPFLSDQERDTMLLRAANFLTSETDYRGFSDEEGWRHGIAHGADWLMQLSLNPALTDVDRKIIYQSVTSQVQAADGHAYIFGEVERLARPYLFAARGEDADEDMWMDRLIAVANPSPMTDWSEAYGSEEDLARLHNLKAFLRVLLVNTSMSENPSLKAMVPAILAVIRTLPA